MGTGNDTVYLNPNGAVNNVLVQSASGDNYVFLGNASNATGSVEVTLGTGDDTIYVEGLNSQGSIDLGSGSDSFNVLDNSISGFTLQGGDGTDTITLSENANAVDSFFENVTSVEKVVFNGVNSDLTLGAYAQAAGITNIAANGATGTDVDISGMSSDVVITSGSGSNIITAGSGANNISTGADDDTIKFTSSNFTLADTVAGGAGTNTIQVTTTAVVVDADFTNVTQIQKLVLAGTGSQDIDLGTLADAAGIVNITASAGTASDINVSAMTNNVTIVSGAGGDLVTAGSGNDGVSTGSGNDTLIGGAGADSLTGGAGDDKFTGGAGADKFTADGGADSITDFGTGGVDKVDITAGSLAATVSADYTATDAGDIDNDMAASAAVFTVANDVDFDASAATGTTKGITITASGNSSASTLTGTDQADVITGGAAGDTLSGDAGNDTIAGNAGDDTIAGGSGSDTLTGGAGADAITGGAGDDKMTGGAGNDQFTADGGADVITDFGGVDKVDITAGTGCCGDCGLRGYSSR